MASACAFSPPMRARTSARGSLPCDAVPGRCLRRARRRRAPRLRGLRGRGVEPSPRSRQGRPMLVVTAVMLREQPFLGQHLWHTMPKKARRRGDGRGRHGDDELQSRGVMSRRIRRDYSSSVRFAYLDTKFYSFLKHDDVRLRAISFFKDKSLIVLVTMPHWAELHEADRQHALVSRFWDDIGAMIVAPPMLEAYQDLDAYPSVDRRRLPRILGPISDDVVRGFLGGNPVEGSPTGYSASVLSESLNQAKAQPRSREFIDEVKSLSNPSSRTSFEDRWIIHYLLQNAQTRSHPNFTKLCPPLVPGSFPSLRGQAAMVWWASVLVRI